MPFNDNILSDDILPLLPLGDGEYTSVQFNLVKPTLTDYQFNLFNADTLINFPTFELPIINPPPYISSSNVGYNFFIRGLLHAPIMIRQIILVGQNTPQLNTPLNIIYQDANGIQCQQYRLPGIYISTNQYQSYMSYIDFEPMELVLDNSTYISSYNVTAGTTVVMVLFYKQISLNQFINPNSSVFRLSEQPKYAPNNRSEAQLRFWANRPSKRPSWLKPIIPWKGFVRNSNLDI